jgi:hypothetical protein
MDALVQEEINRLNPQTICSDMESDIDEEIVDWLMTQDNWLQTFVSREQVVKAFWENRLN